MGGEWVIPLGCGAVEGDGEVCRASGTRGEVVEGGRLVER